MKLETQQQQQYLHLDLWLSELYWLHEMATVAGGWLQTIRQTLFGEQGFLRISPIRGHFQECLHTRSVCLAQVVFG